jgi:hypothetical protein
MKVNGFTPLPLSSWRQDLEQEQPTGKKVGLDTVTRREISALTGNCNMTIQPAASSLY